MRGVVMSENLVVVMTTVTSDEDAESLSHQLVQERLAACVQVVGIQSHFRWEGSVQQESERLLFIKTGSDRAEDVISRLEEIHPYDLPEIIVVPSIAGLPGYVSWAIEESRPGG
jgi:periplasmic divalent cation tolerance protein